VLHAALVDRERERLQAGDEIGADEASGLLLADVDVVSRVGLGRRREDGLGQPVGLAQPRRQRHAADASGLLVLLPAGPRQIAARHALDRHRLGPPDEHRPAAQHVGVTAHAVVEAVHVEREEVVRDEVAHPIEPERGQLREHLALVGNARAEHVVERGNPIGGDDEQIVAELVDVADLAAPEERQSVDLGLEQGSGGEHVTSRRRRDYRRGVAESTHSATVTGLRCATGSSSSAGRLAGPSRRSARASTRA
jgi:hypothetical protein